jgi:Icc-related predicted phosphoesterase
MKISLHSDIHLAYADFYLPGGDVLILAGDICEASELSRFAYDPYNRIYKEGDLKRLDRMQRFFIEECAKYRHVLMVMGNHEHYGGAFHKTYWLLKAMLPDNVRLLEKESVEIDGVLFIGGTLWTDFNKKDPLTLTQISNMMSDYKNIKMHDTHKNVWHNLTPAKVLDDHIKTKSYFKNILDENRRSGANKPVVIISHHAPSSLSIDPEYIGQTTMNGAYYSDLSEMILDNPEIKFWVHGHVHARQDYNIGNTRVLCNPRGYYGYERIANRLQDCLFEL